MEELRTSKGITAIFVAKKLRISRDRLKRIENGDVSLPVEFVPILANLYGVTFDEIIERRIKEWKK
ncbi:MAG: helix-turn-helix transcriptional regulator [Clostridium sp.]|uniref:helix-turn-helix domain-containing protein n=1 Tax=Clostridium sp. TaxID=1506 RepID=UPI002906F8FE|nr:helix-turn-helix transcriptional regulator [Clostridium sp.]MDU5111668.1 helix-turn-helix transcriptional regulator [Clostridium sp.]